MFSYPTENLLGHWTNRVFTQDSVVAVDYSDNKNDAVLKTGRAFDFNKQQGSPGGYLEIPGIPEGVHKVVLLVRAANSTTFNQLEVSSSAGVSFTRLYTIGTDWEIRNFTFESFTNKLNLTDDIRVADTVNFTFDGQIAYIELYSLNGNLVDIFPLNDYDSTVSDIASKTFIGINGNTMTYVGVSPPVMVDKLESPVPQLAALDFNISGNQLIPKHLTDDTDALGNPITNERLTNTTFNVPPGGLVEVSDITAYNALQTAMGWFYYYSTDQIFMGLGTPTISAVSGSLTSSGITTPTYYINGVQSVTLNTGWNFIVVTTTTAFDAGPISWDEGKSDKISIYSDAKSPALILETYNKTYLKYFPSDPTIGEEWQHDGVTWTFDGNSWNF